jgi:precorrin-6Y C5,15-methyltransferase (decarboxylating)
VPENSKVYIIGVGASGATSLLPEVRPLIERAGIVLGGERLLTMFPSLTGQKITIRNNLSEVADLIKRNLGDKRIVVLASGDPGFHGIARYLTRELDKGTVEIIPNVSAMQLAFARIKESWDDATLTSVHSKPIKRIADIVRANHKIGIFTDDNHTPSEIAKVLQELGIENCRAHVCQDLGTPKESNVATDLYSLIGKDFSPLNVLILLRKRQETIPQPLLGIPEESFLQKREGCITKLEVRAISLAKLALTENSIVWDIGAGSGAISIEASFLASRGSIFAIEKSADAVEIIKENMRRFGRHNTKVIQASAPDQLEELPAPDAIFIGGSGGRMAEILLAAGVRLKAEGRLVVNLVTLETLHRTIEALQTGGFMFEVTLVNIARGKEISRLTRLEALNPIFVLTAQRRKEGML